MIPKKFSSNDDSGAKISLPDFFWHSVGMPEENAPHQCNHRQDVTQNQFYKPSKAGLNSVFLLQDWLP